MIARSGTVFHKSPELFLLKEKKFRVFLMVTVHHVVEWGEISRPPFQEEVRAGSYQKKACGQL